MPQKPEPNKPTFKGGDIGVNLLASLLVAGGLGYGLDVWLNTLPLCLLIGMALGFAARLRKLWQLLKST